jgi:FkbM family methyltransferase
MSKQLTRAGEVLRQRAELSYSQLGEDRMLAVLLEGTAGGFYVDIGAHHPTRYSNTACLYQEGWHGIDVDPRPGTAPLFQRWRPRDIALEVGIARQPGSLRFFVFEDAAISTFSPEWAAMQQETNGRRMLGAVDVPVMTLADVLDGNLPPGQEIDLLTVDAEGLDLDIFQSNDWNRYRPRFIVAEVAGIRALDRIGESPIVQFLAAQRYQAVAKSSVSVFFERLD